MPLTCVVRGWLVHERCAAKQGRCGALGGERSRWWTGNQLRGSWLRCDSGDADRIQGRIYLRLAYKLLLCEWIVCGLRWRSAGSFGAAEVALGPNGREFCLSP